MDSKFKESILQIKNEDELDIIFSNHIAKLIIELYNDEETRKHLASVYSVDEKELEYKLHIGGAHIDDFDEIDD